MNSRVFSRIFSESALKVAAIASAPLFYSDHAFAETTSDVKVSSSAAYDTNPFLSVDGNSEVASFRLEMVPTIAHRDGVSELRLSARVEHIEYSRLYDAVQNLSVELDAKNRVSERIEVSARVFAASLVSTTDNTGLQAGTDPQAPSLPDNSDITLLGTQQRRTTIGAQTNFNFRIGEYDQLRLSSSFDIQRYDQTTGFGDSDFVRHSVAYERQLNQNLSLGGMFEISAGDFKYLQFGDARSMSPQFVINARINSRLNVAASAGISFTRVDLPTGQLNSTGFSGSGTLCYKDSASGFCLSGQRQLVPTAFGGLRRQTSVGTSYSKRLSSRDTLQTGTSISRASAPLIGGSQKFKSVRIFGRYERRLGERLALFASASYADSSDLLNSRKPNAQAIFGISYRFGNLR